MTEQCSRIFYATVLHIGFGGFSSILEQFFPGIITYVHGFSMLQYFTPRLADFPLYWNNYFLELLRIRCYSYEYYRRTFFHRTFCPWGCFSRWTFCPKDVLSLWTFCPRGCFVPLDVLTQGRFVPLDVLSQGRFVPGRLVSGRFVSGRFVYVPTVHLTQTICFPPWWAALVSLTGLPVWCDKVREEKARIRAIFCSRHFRFLY